MEDEYLIELFALTLPYAPNMVDVVPADSVAHGGVSIADATAVDGFSVILFAYVGQAENDLITLYLNDEFANKLTIAKGKEAENTTLTIPSGLFQRGRNNIKFGVKRPSQNEEFTKDLMLLYRSSPPGDVPSVLAINVSHESIGADEADDVSVTVTYKNAQWYDRIFVDCNGVVVRHQLVPVPPISAAPQTVVIPIGREVLEQGGDDSDFTFKFRVVDNLTNPSGPPVWSDIVNADVHLDRLTLTAPDLSEDPDDPADDPSTIDLAKVRDFLYVLVHVFSPLWTPDDTIRVDYTCKPPEPGTVVTHSAEATVGRLPFTHKLQVPVAKVIADSEVSVIYELVRGGKVIATSIPATAQVIGKTTGPVGNIALGRRQNALVMSRDGLRVYVGHEGAISVIDTATNQLIDTIVTLNTGYFSGIVITPDDAKIYAASTDPTQVQVIDAGSNRVIKNIPTEVFLNTIVMSSDGSRIFVHNSSAINGSVGVIDTRSDQVINTFPTGSWTAGGAISPDGQRFYYCEYSTTSSVLVVIDATTGRRMSAVSVPQHRGSVMLSPDGSRIYLPSSNDSDFSLLELEADTLRLLRTINKPYPPNNYSLAFSPDNSRLYSCAGTVDIVLIFDIPSVQIIGTIKTGNNPLNVACTLDGKRLYVSNRGSDFVSVVATI